jgi:hypothetical protein
MRFFVTSAFVMTDSTPSYFPMLEPHLVPAMSSVRRAVGKSMHAGMADYALRAATLSHSEAVMALTELHDRLPPLPFACGTRRGSRNVVQCGPPGG